MSVCSPQALFSFQNSYVLTYGLCGHKATYGNICYQNRQCNNRIKREPANKQVSSRTHTVISNTNKSTRNCQNSWTFSIAHARCLILLFNKAVVTLKTIFETHLTLVQIMVAITAQNTYAYLYIFYKCLNSGLILK